MKKRIFLLPLLFIAACSGSDKTGPEPTDPTPVNWSVVEVRNGLRWLSFRGDEPVSGAKQVINALEVDLGASGLAFEFQYYPAKTTMSAAIGATEGAIAGTNASFGTPHTFIRTNGTTWCDLSQADPSIAGNWRKHEAAVWYDGEQTFGFLNYEGDPYGCIPKYQATTYPNMFSSRPMLIEDGKGVEWKGSGYDSFSKNVEPRTVLAQLREGKILLLTVDGRWYGMAAGMTYVQLRDFLKLNFNPLNAINMDGGGSTTMYVKGKGKNGIVNYPCDGTASSGYKEYTGSFTERSVPTFFVIRER